MKKYQQQLLIAELMGTLETLLVYCPNKNIREQAEQRLSKLKEQYEETNQSPPLGDFIIKNKFICQQTQTKQ